MANNPVLQTLITGGSKIDNQTGKKFLYNSLGYLTCDGMCFAVLLVARGPHKYNWYGYTIRPIRAHSQRSGAAKYDGRQMVQQADLRGRQAFGLPERGLSVMMPVSSWTS